jgi:hypothetical protein
MLPEWHCYFFYTCELKLNRITKVKESILIALQNWENSLRFWEN